MTRHCHHRPDFHALSFARSSLDRFEVEIAFHRRLAQSRIYALICTQQVGTWTNAGHKYRNIAHWKLLGGVILCKKRLVPWLCEVVSGKVDDHKILTTECHIFLLKDEDINRRGSRQSVRLNLASKTSKSYAWRF